jgi:hypothetical protein
MHTPFYTFYIFLRWPFCAGRSLLPEATCICLFICGRGCNHGKFCVSIHINVCICVQTCGTHVYTFVYKHAIVYIHVCTHICTHAHCSSRFPFLILCIVFAAFVHKHVVHVCTFYLCTNMWYTCVQTCNCIQTNMCTHVCTHGYISSCCPFLIVYIVFAAWKVLLPVLLRFTGRCLSRQDILQRLWGLIFGWQRLLRKRQFQKEIARFIRTECEEARIGQEVSCFRFRIPLYILSTTNVDPWPIGWNQQQTHARPTGGKRVRTLMLP